MLASLLKRADDMKILIYIYKVYIHVCLKSKQFTAIE